MSRFRHTVTWKTHDLILGIKGSQQARGRCAELSRHLCTETKSQLAELLALLADWYDERTNQSDYSSKVTWEFEDFVTRAIMEHLAPPRMEVASISALSSTKSKALVIWAVLQVHIRLNSIIDAGFKAHSVVTTAIIL